jgi:hypothetical protein
MSIESGDQTRKAPLGAKLSAFTFRPFRSMQMKSTKPRVARCALTLAIELCAFSALEGVSLRNN